MKEPYLTFISQSYKMPHSNNLHIIIDKGVAKLSLEKGRNIYQKFCSLIFIKICIKSSNNLFSIIQVKLNILMKNVSKY